MSQEDIEWFKSTFHPIPKPQLPDDSVEYSVYHIPSGSGVVVPVDEVSETRARLVQVQRTAAELAKNLLKDYIWQREAFHLEIVKEDGIIADLPLFVPEIYNSGTLLMLLQELRLCAGGQTLETLLKMNG